MAEVQVPPLAILQGTLEVAVRKVREASAAVGNLWLLDLAKELDAIGDRLRGTSFALTTDTTKPAHLASVLTAQVPD